MSNCPRNHAPTFSRILTDSCVTFDVLCTSFYAWHIGLFDVVVRKQHFDAFAELGREAHVGALIASYFARLAGVEVRLACLALDHLARFADADALGNGLVGFHGHTTRGKSKVERGKRLQ